MDQVDLNKQKVYDEFKALDVKENTIEEADKYFVFGRYYLLSSGYEQAVKWFEKAVKKYRLLDDYAGICYSSIYAAMGCRELNKIGLARNKIREAYELALEKNDGYITLFCVLSSMALYTFENRDDEVKELEQQAEMLVHEVKHPKLSGDYYNNLGLTYLETGEYDKGLKELKKAYAFYLEHYGAEDIINVIIVMANIAEVCYLKGMYDEAIENFEAVERRLQENGFAVGTLLDAKSFLRKLYYIKKDYKKAVEKSREYVELLQKMTEDRLSRPSDELSSLRKQLEHSRENLNTKIDEISGKNELLQELIANNELVGNIGKRLTSTLNFDTIFDIVAEESEKIIDYSAFSFGLIEGDCLVIKQIKMKDGVEPVKLPFYIPLDSHKYVAVHCIKENVDVKTNSSEDYKKYVRESKYVATAKGVRKKNYNHSSIYVRLLHHGEVMGVMFFQHQAKNAYTEEQFQVIKSIASFVSIAINNYKNNKVVEDKMMELERIYKVDALTGLENRRSFNECVKDYLDSGKDFYLLFADMNHLKVINDDESHIMGDKYLCAVADVFRECAPEQRAFRLSGDEFGLVLLGMSREGVYELTGKIRETCAKKTLGRYPLALAMGYSHSEKEKTFEQIFAKAESRMYQDKHDYYVKYASHIRKRE